MNIQLGLLKNSFTCVFKMRLKCRCVDKEQGEDDDERKKDEGCSDSRGSKAGDGGGRLWGIGVPEDTQDTKTVNRRESGPGNGKDGEKERRRRRKMSPRQTRRL